MRTTPTPDIGGMVNRGQDRLRRRNTMRRGLAAAAVLLVAGGVYGVTQIGGNDPDADVASGPSEPSESAAVPPDWADTNGGPTAPGTYRTFVGFDADSEVIEADLTVEGANWAGSNYPVAYAGERFAGIGAYQVESVAGGSGCLDEGKVTGAANEPQQLARQLARLPRSEVVQPPAATEAFGHNTIHLRSRIDAACGASIYRVVETPVGGRGISYFNVSPKGPRFVVVDFWVVDFNGTTVVVDMFRTEDAPRDLLDQAAAARESITFVEAE
ncbi:hypothetical protein DDE18_21655 [Nocardioides gansuensis]|uniref:Uncharacterized protein n=1 Tax=Nocardioides gansuensis TaxID=2138300 RepID=A0A2T8F4W8_9ACTN|nr:hypothetical protein [Nocardioides gansuensis]PVG80751.1 hypothetical protein DDE18_21655 [Nocardioides gansuensis]